MKIGVLTIHETSGVFIFDFSTYTKRKGSYHQIDFFQYQNEITHDFYKHANQDVIQKINLLLMEKGFKNIEFICNLNLGSIFIEQFEIPKLNRKEEKNAIFLEMEKRYHHFQNRYKTHYEFFPTKRNTKNVSITLIDKENYQALTKVIQQLSIRIKKMYYYSQSLFAAVKTNFSQVLSQQYVYLYLSNQFLHICIKKDDSLGFLVTHLFNNKTAENTPVHDSILCQLMQKITSSDDNKIIQDYYYIDPDHENDNEYMNECNEKGILLLPVILNSTEVMKQLPDLGAIHEFNAGKKNFF